MGITVFNQAQSINLVIKGHAMAKIYVTITFLLLVPD
jgi:hypothetical protein